MILIIFILLTPIIAGLLAYIWAYYQLWRSIRGDYDKIRNDCWTTNLRGEKSKDALRVHRVRIAKWSGFGMDRDEAIYWGTNRDSNGNKIKHNYKYSIEGVDLDTRWWCITVYRNGFFIPNKYKRYSFSKTDINRKGDGSWVIKISTEEQNGNWIPLGEKKGDIRITLRCYNPGRFMIENGENVNLPKIIRED